MKRYIVILFAFLSILDLDAQEYFFNYVGGWTNNYSIELDDGYLLMGRGFTEQGVFRYELFFNEISNNGVLIDTVVYQWELAESTSSQGQNNSQTTVFIDENNYVTTVSIGYDLGDSESHWEAGLLNYNINTQEFSVISETTNNIYTVYYSLTHPNDSTLLVGARLFDDGELEEKILLYDMDMSGNERWHKIFYEGCAYCLMEPRQILPLNNGNIAYLYDFITEENLLAYHERERAVIVIVDGETGEQIGDPIYPGDEENYRICAGGMVELDNGDLMVSYTDPYYYDEDGEWHFNQSGVVHVERYSQDGILQFAQSFIDEIPTSVSVDNTGFYLYRVTQMQWLDDGNILISGTTGYGGLLLKINSNVELIWFREHFPHAYEDNESWVTWYTRIYHVLPTSDGGFMCTGEYVNHPGQLYPEGIQSAIALKVDQYGCLEEGCQVGIFEQSMEHLELNVYPNPSTSIFQIELPNENEVYSLKVYNMIGEEIRQALNVRGFEYILDMSGVAAGVYLLQMMGADGVVYVERIGVED